VRIFRRARIQGSGGAILASVHCAIRCHVVLGVENGPDASRVITGNALIGVVGSLPSPALTVTVQIDDGPILTGHSRLY
jgi:hypothetical protein